MKFIDFFAGVGGFRLGLERAGVTCVGACEIAEFQRHVYATRFGDAPTFDDVTTIIPDVVPAADLWCGGWPCQGVSSAGLRKGVFNDPRSNLIWTLLDLADDCEALGTGPTWLLLENVPGLLSGKDWECGSEQHGGGAEDPCPSCGRPLGDAAAGHVPVSWFGAVLGALAERGWVGAWRVLDAQWFGVAQHRERVFLLARRAGAAGPSPAEVLLEPPGVRRDPPPRRAAGQEAAGTVASGPGGGRRLSADDAAGRQLVVDDAACSFAGVDAYGASGGGAGEHRNLVVVADVAPTVVASGRGRTCDGKSEDEGGGLVGYAQAPFSIYPEHGQGADLVAVPVDVSPAVTVTDGAKQTERGVRVVVGAFDLAQLTHPDNRSRCAPGAPSPTIAAQAQVHVYSIAGAGPDTAHPVATKPRNTAHGPDTFVIPLDVRNSTRDGGGGRGAAGLGVGEPGDPAYTITRSCAGVFAHGVRRLMPIEIERLFGFPDGWTDVDGAADSKRYEALGNSVAVPVVEWVAKRLMRALKGA